MTAAVEEAAEEHARVQERIRTLNESAARLREERTAELQRLRDRREAAIQEAHAQFARDLAEHEKSVIAREAQRVLDELGDAWKSWARTHEGVKDALRASDRHTLTRHEYVHEHSPYVRFTCSDGCQGPELKGRPNRPEAMAVIVTTEDARERHLEHVTARLLGEVIVW